MMIIDGYEITAFTNLREEICLKVLSIIEREFGEIGDFCIEDNEVSFSCYRGYYEGAPKVMATKEIKLKLIDKFDDPVFSVAYKIILLNNNR
ncbi:MAG: hypothetical protein CVT88_01210 [Candidatus Altiarchaeales archaeon HGW-Altiarchaeales-1]|nr:MAG: hypothetical protein CVT88_01210 [Candidatus Altiarchaeales archaeon HGW-Altiarchaeales-1]